MAFTAERTLTTGEMMKAQWRVLFALMLRDIRARFAGSAWGFLISIGWPLSHVLVLLIVHSFIGRAAPYGTSPALWYATGVIPFMAFNYINRFTMLGLVLNKTLLTFPIVSVSDILFARVILEILSSCLVILILMGVFLAAGIDFIPLDLTQACFALLGAMLLGFGYGILNAIIASFMPFWIVAISLFTIVLWLSSGVFFDPNALPAVAQYYLSFLPTFEIVQWMRSSYYIGYGEANLSRTYVVGFGACLLFVGLLMERLLRGRILRP